LNKKREAEVPALRAPLPAWRVRFRAATPRSTLPLARARAV
jgi:hypothetical protein